MQLVLASVSNYSMSLGSGKKRKKNLCEWLVGPTYTTSSTPPRLMSRPHLRPLRLPQAAESNECSFEQRRKLPLKFRRPQELPWMRAYQTTLKRIMVTISLIPPWRPIGSLITLIAPAHKVKLNHNQQTNSVSRPCTSPHSLLPNLEATNTLVINTYNLCRKL